MTRPPSGAVEEKEQGLKKGPWTPDEDQKLLAYIQQHGHGSWRTLPLNAGLQRCGKSCRLRWTNYLCPDIKRGRFSQEEDRMIVHLHAILGNRWSAIASHLPRRTDNEIKNYWNTHLKKRLLQMGIDPVTHKSTAMAVANDIDSILPVLPRRVLSSTLSHISQWENVVHSFPHLQVGKCAESEARLARQSSSVSDLETQTAFNGVNPCEATQAKVSTSFMSSWKAQVAETLRPSFGVVEIDKTPTNPVNLENFLQDWESSLQAPQTSKLGPFSAYGSPIDVPEFASSGTASEVMSPQYTPATYTLPSSSQITERLLAWRGCSIDKTSLMFSGFDFPGESNQFDESSTTTLHGPDYDSSYTSSPCVSGNSGDSVDFLEQSLNSLIQQGYHQSRRCQFMFPSEPTFWSRQEDVLQPPQSYNLILPELTTSQAALKPPKGSFMLSTQVGVPNNIPIPRFDFLC